MGRGRDVQGEEELLVQAEEKKEMNDEEAKAATGRAESEQTSRASDVPQDTSDASKKTRYLLTGGGTGGHVYPAIAIADELRRREPNAEFLYVGVRGKAEEDIVPKRGYPLTFVRSRGWPGARASLALVKFALSLTFGVFQAMRILRKFQPQVIIATGGYVSAPIMLAWLILKRFNRTDAKAFVQEQNLMPGRLNRLVGRLATRVGVSFDESRRFFPNAEWLGYPVRQEVGDTKSEEARAKLGIPADAKVVLAFGGSQGARTINRAVVDALPTLLKDPKIWVLHGCGTYNGANYKAEQDTKQRLEALSLPAEAGKRYRLERYIDSIEDYYAATDLVICRAGAGTLTEMAICALPALVIPKANLPGDHQVKNARAMAAKHAVRVLYERTERAPEGLIEVLPGEELAAAVHELLDDPTTLAEMKREVQAFADVGALGRLATRVQEMRDGTMPALTAYDVPRSGEPEFTEMSGGGLVSFLTRHGKDSLSEEAREYIAYRTDAYLASPAWQSRNVGVKLVGLLGLTEGLELILFLLNDKTPAPRFHRWVGGDFKQVGFLRRNAYKTLRELNVWNDEVREVVLQGLTDPYFEVRSWACDTIVHFSDRLALDKEKFLNALEKCTLERNFEVVCAALHALGEIETRSERVYALLHAFFTHPNWLVRQSVVKALRRLVERKVLDAGLVKADLDQLLMTSSGFVPRFHLREEMVHLSKSLANARSEQTPSEGA